MPPWFRETWYNKLGIPKDIIKPLAISKYAKLFEFLFNEFNINPVLASVALIQFPKRLRRKKLNINFLTEDIIIQIFKAYRDKQISRDGILYYMEIAARFGYLDSEQIPSLCTESELEQAFSNANELIKKTNIYNPEKLDGLVIRNVMKSLRGRIEFSEVIKKMKSIKGDN
jgi:Glu-tRNA(Gln) amidotransferase subunit E-like FAD-binding protein